MLRLAEINVELLQQWREKLIKMSLMTKKNIQDIYIESGDVIADDLDKLVYSYDIPLYQKMIFRFVNCDLNTAVFYHQIDPNNQHLLRRFFGSIENYRTSSVMHGLIEFFAWISNSLGSYNIVELEGIEYKSGTNYELEENSKFVHQWRKNPVIFFFDVIDDVQKRTLIDRYNTQCVIPWNKHLDKGF